MIKIFQIGKFFPPNWGGIETVVFNLHCSLSKIDNLDFHTFVHGGVNSVKDNVHHFSYKEILRAPFSVSMWKAIFSNRHNADLFIIHVPNPFVLLLFVLLNTRFVIYWHAPSYSNSFLMKLDGFLSKFAYKKAKYILVATNRHISALPNFVNPCRVRVWEYPVSQSLCSVLDVQEKAHLGDLQIVSVGRLVNYKGFSYLIDAANLLREAGCKFNIKILGEGPEWSNLTDLINRYDLGDFVQIICGADDNKRDEYLSLANLFVFPSINNREMYGLVQVEALSKGLPIIVSDLPESGVPHLVEQSGAGVFVKPADPLGIAQAVLRYDVDRSLLREHSRLAKVYMSSRCREDDTFGVLEEVLK